MLQYFATYVAVLGPHDPPMIPEMMAYLRLIVQVSQDWVRYDVAFRRQAALTGNRKWSAINTTLYSMCFTGRATRARRCEIRFTSTHTERECAQHGDPDPDVTSRMRTLETAVIALAGPGTWGLCRGSPRAAAAGLPVHPSGETCRKWNSDTGCTFPRCRHSHACSSCEGAHPATQATSGDARTRSHAAIRGHTADPPILGTPHYQGRGYEQLLSSLKIGNINCNVGGGVLYWDRMIGGGAGSKGGVDQEPHMYIAPGV